MSRSAQTYRLISSLTLSVIIMLTWGCSSDDLDHHDLHEKGFYSSQLIWPSLNIPICWEDTSEVSEVDQRLVKAAAETTWGAHVPFNFSGWGQCQSQSDGIRIRSLQYQREGRNRNPHTKGLGTRIRGAKEGMVLKFKFSSDHQCSTSEQNRRACVYVVAVHEFGHALGIAHEQNRPDTPSSCDKKHQQGSQGDVLVGSWDLHSVMNYCNPKWSGHGQLSEGDIDTIKFAYAHLISERHQRSATSSYDETTNHNETYDGNQSCADEWGEPVTCDVTSAYQSTDTQSIETCYDEWGWVIECGSDTSAQTQTEETCYDEWGWEIECGSDTSAQTQTEETCYDEWGWEIECGSDASAQTQTEETCYDDWGWEVECDSNMSSMSQHEEVCYDDWGWETECH